MWQMLSCNSRRALVSPPEKTWVTVTKTSDPQQLGEHACVSFHVHTCVCCVHMGHMIVHGTDA